MALDSNPIAAGVGRTFNPKAVVHGVTRAKDPSDVLLRLKDLSVRFADENTSPVPHDVAQEALELLGEASRQLHGPLIMHATHDDFETSWAFARFLHRLEKNKDALAWVNHAIEVGEDHPKLTNAMARKVEILLDLHAELPGLKYDEKAMQAADDVHGLEGSDYTAELYDRAEETLFERMRKYGPQLVAVEPVEA